MLPLNRKIIMFQMGVLKSVHNHDLLEIAKGNSTENVRK